MQWEGRHYNIEKQAGNHGTLRNATKMFENCRGMETTQKQKEQFLKKEVIREIRYVGTLRLKKLSNMITCSRES